LRSLTRKLESVEQEIENLEARIEDWDKKLADSSSYMELMKDPDFYPKYEKQKEELSSKMNLWEEMQIKKDQLEHSLPS
jgi:DNA repair exonuclease SbcCD ATPase subunit